MALSPLEVRLGCESSFDAVVAECFVEVVAVELALVLHRWVVDELLHAVVGGLEATDHGVESRGCVPFRSQCCKLLEVSPVLSALFSGLDPFLFAGEVQCCDAVRERTAHVAEHGRHSQGSWHGYRVYSASNRSTSEMAMRIA